MSDKKILIFGANGGLGKALARHYLSLGEKVFGTSRKNDTDILHQNYHHFCCDLLSETDLDQLIKFFKKNQLTVHIIINCAAISSRKPLMFSNKEDLRNVFETNLISHYEICKKFSKFLLIQTQKSAIIGFSSIHANDFATGAAFYALTKKGLEVLTNSFSQELQDTNISFYCLVLSYIKGIGLANSLSNSYKEKHMSNNINAREINFSEITNVIDKILNKETTQGNPVIRIGC